MEHHKDLIKILFAEDLTTDVELAKRQIIKEGFNIDYIVVDTENEFRDALENFNPDIIISDYSMPEFDGMSALKITREAKKYYPFIVLTGSMNEETAVACMKAGANDYVIKEQIKRLPFAIQEAIENNKSRQEKIRIQKQLRASEERFRLLFNNLNQIAIQGVAEDGTVVYWNHASEILFGYSENEAVGKPIYDLYIPENSIESTKKKLNRLYQTGELDDSRDVTLVRKDFSEVQVFSNEVIIELSGHEREVYSIQIDLTERNKLINDILEAKDRAEESDRLKSAFLMNMSHEIRTPMNGILGFTDLLSRPQLTGEQKEKYIEIIQDSGQRMLNTVNDIIEISKIETGQVSLKMNRINLAHEIGELCSFFEIEAKKKGLTIIYHSDTNDTVTTDLNKINSIASNIIKNAIKFTEKGTIEVGCKKENDHFLIHVKDTGIGIPDDRKEAVFNRFEQADIADTRAYQGSGLGLSIAKSYVDMLEGKIWLESKSGVGTTFYFTIPASTDKNQSKINQSPDSDKQEQEPGLNRKLKVLIAEDEEAATYYLSLILEDIASEILTADNGNKVIELCKKHPDIDLVLMDIKMPGINGYDATRIIKKQNRNIKVIAQTAFAILGDREKAINAGCDDYITKPINEGQLHSLISKHFS